MNWETVKETLTKFSRSSAAAARESMEKLGDKATEYSILNKLKLESKSIEHKIQSVFIDLGREYYNRSKLQTLSKPEEDFKKQLDEIDRLQTELAKKNAELNELYKEYDKGNIDKEKIKNLKKELEDGGGTIEQITVAVDSAVIGKKLKTIKLPKEVLVGTILRGKEVIIPDGTHSIKKGDRITLLGKSEDVEQARQLFESTAKTN